MTVELSGATAAGRGPRYPNPYFDIAQMRLPLNAAKDLFEACTWATVADPLIAPAVRKMAAYPITPLQFSAVDGGDLDESLKAEWKRVLVDQMQIASHQIEMGISYYGLGNEIVSIRQAFIKMVSCAGCGKTSELRALKPRRDYTVSGAKIGLNCGCGVRGTPKVWDAPISGARGLSLKRWCIKDIDIEYYPFSGTREYYYTPSDHVKAQLERCDHKAVCETPTALMEAIAAGKTFRLEARNVFHFMPPGLAMEDGRMGWGFPPILPTLKEGYYAQLMKKANEALLQEHIVPFRWLSPASTSTVDVFRAVNLTQWRRQVESQLQHWRQDPNHLTVFPLPLTMQQFGGQGKSLLMVPELQEIAKTRLAGMGVPEELVFGGLRWTASSVSLRMLENMFLTYRDAHHVFLNQFLIPTLARVLRMVPVRAEMSAFKMGDDVQAKQLLLQLAQTTKISDGRLLSEFGYDFREEQRRIDAENRVRAHVLLRQKLEETHIQGEMTVLQAAYAARMSVASTGGGSETLPATSSGAATRLEEVQQQMGPPPPELRAPGAPNSPRTDTRPPPTVGPPRRGGGTTTV